MEGGVPHCRPKPRRGTPYVFLFSIGWTNTHATHQQDNRCTQAQLRKQTHARTQRSCRTVSTGVARSSKFSTRRRRPRASARSMRHGQPPASPAYCGRHMRRGTPLAHPACADAEYAVKGADVPLAGGSTGPEEGDGEDGARPREPPRRPLIADDRAHNAARPVVVSVQVMIAFKPQASRPQSYQPTSRAYRFRSWFFDRLMPSEPAALLLQYWQCIWSGAAIRSRALGAMTRASHTPRLAATIAILFHKRPPRAQAGVDAIVSPGSRQWGCWTGRVRSAHGTAPEKAVAVPFHSDKTE